ncbi:MAG: hypothetical protein KIS81_00450 [Maricaulaceae bacterium]|nr:hypothetical protein [Maricaulaceae bacterium]
MIETRPADMSPEQLAALLCARLCHDLVSPVAALGAALSVLDDEDASDMRDDALNLVRESARQAHVKLEFARLAFGAGGSAPGVIDCAELKRLAEGLFGTVKPDLVWKSAPPALEKSAARLLLNLCLQGIESAPRGGTVTVEAAADAGGGARIRVVAEGPRARLDPKSAAALDGQAPEDGFDGRSIQPYYAGLIARAAGGRVSARADGERVEFVALTAPPASAAAA